MTNAHDTPDCYTLKLLDDKVEILRKKGVLKLYDWSTFGKILYSKRGLHCDD